MRRAKFAGTVGSSTVVVANVVSEHNTQVPLTEDQHSVGEFGSDGAYESFCEAVRDPASDGFHLAARRKPISSARTLRPALQDAMFGRVAAAMDQISRKDHRRLTPQQR